MKNRAVIFDLFGTLINSLSTREFDGVLAKMATILSVREHDFVRLWAQKYDERAVGTLTTEECIKYVCRCLGVQPQGDEVEHAVRLRLDLTRHALVPRRGAVETISELKTMGYRTGLISDCSEEIPVLWQDADFAPLIDVPIFSCSVGLKKPDPRIYLLACERLGVRPEDCIYIGDGGSRELTGASAVGMRAVQIRIPPVDQRDAHRVDAEEWTGETIHALPDVLTLV